MFLGRIFVGDYPHPFQLPRGPNNLRSPPSLPLDIKVDIKSQWTGSGSRHSLWEKYRAWDPLKTVPIASRACADQVVDMIFFGFEMDTMKDSRNRSKPRPSTLDVLWYMWSNLRMPPFSPTYTYVCMLIYILWNVYMLTYIDIFMKRHLRMLPLST